MRVWTQKEIFEITENPDGLTIEQLEFRVTRTKIAIYQKLNQLTHEAKTISR